MTDRDYGFLARHRISADLSRKPYRASLVALLLLAGALMVRPAYSQERTILEDYTTQMPGPKQEVSLGPDLFGDKTDAYSGATTLLVTDVDLPGNGDLPVRYQRSLQAFDSGLGNQHNSNALTNFLTWSRYEVPYLSGVYASGGWVSKTENGSTTQQRCTYATPPDIPDGKSDGNDYWAANEYSHGNHLYLPGGGEQLMLIVGAANGPSDGATYRRATKDRWYFSCLPSTTNGVAGEGFLGRAPDGKKYYFTHAVNWRQVSTLRKLNVLNDIIALTRFEHRMLLTRVEDRYGNWVSYGYSGKDLTSISASDGRQLTIAYASAGGPVSSVSDGARTWTYDYSAGFRVAFPDSTTWRSYVTGGITRSKPTSCEGSRYSGSATLTIEHRSGAVGTFAFAPLRTGLSHVPYSGYPGSCEQRPRYYDNIALSTKTISGAGVPSATWSYAYGPPNGCHVGGASACTAASPVTRSVDVTGPGTFTRYTFGNKYRDTEGALFRVETGAAASSILRNESMTWETFNAPAFVPSMSGTGFLASIVRMPKTRTIVQDGATYSTVYSNWDSYFQPQTISESGPNDGLRTTQLTYHNDTARWVLGQVASRSSPGRSLSMTFNALADIESSTRDGVTTFFTYHGDGALATVRRPRSLLHEFSNYKRGIPQSETQPEGIALSRVVNDAGFITSSTDGEGRVTGFGRDAMGRITSVDVPLGNDLTLVYSGANKGIRTTTRGGLVETLEYDSLWRPISITRGGITMKYAYDAYGRVTFRSNPDSSTLGARYEYDALGRSAKVTHPDSSYRSYEFGASTRTMRDERGNPTTYTYRAYGDPSDALLMEVAAPEAAASLSIIRAPNGLVTSMTQAGRTRGFGYDARNYLTSETHPETGAITYERDPAGNATARVIGALRIEMSYDGQNRLSGISYSDGAPSVSQSWSKTHKLRSASSSVATRTFEYDANDNLKMDSLSVAGRLLVAHYGYNGNDQLSTLTYPISQRVVSYSPDALGRPTQVSGYLNAVSYWPSGQVSQIDYANGVVTNYEQNSRLWTSGFHTRRGSVYSLSSTYSYDHAGNLIGISDALDASMNRTFGYDKIDRLTSAAGPWGAGAIAYDGAGNISSQALGSFNLAYSYDAQNRLSAVAGSRSAAYGYDALGNVTSAGASTYTYDSVPNLRCVDCSGPAPTQYAYDGLRNRVSITRSGVTTYEFYTMEGNLLVEYTPSEAERLVEHIYLNGQRVAQRTSDQHPPTSVAAARSSIALNSTGIATLTVNVGGVGPGGTVTFSEGGVVLGVAYVINGQASIDVQGLALGSHAITASYSGDAEHSGNSVVLHIRVIDIGWLPAVLDLLLN